MAKKETRTPAAIMRQAAGVRLRAELAERGRRIAELEAGANLFAGVLGARQAEIGGLTRDLEIVRRARDLARETAASAMKERDGFKADAEASEKATAHAYDEMRIWRRYAQTLTDEISAVRAVVGVIGKTQWPAGEKQCKTGK